MPIFGEQMPPFIQPVPLVRKLCVTDGRTDGRTDGLTGGNDLDKDTITKSNVIIFRVTKHHEVLFS